MARGPSESSSRTYVSNGACPAVYQRPRRVDRDLSVHDHAESHSVAPTTVASEPEATPSRTFPVEGRIIGGSDTDIVWPRLF